MLKTAEADIRSTKHALTHITHTWRGEGVVIMDGRTVGVLGGGQLGRMMAEAGHRLGVKVAVLDPLGTASPAGQVAELAVEGSFRDADKIQ